MLVRLLFSLVVGFVVARPRDYYPIPIDVTPPPGSGEPPLPDDLPPGTVLPPGDDVFEPGPIDGIPIPTYPELPPTPPPGYEGTWPPGSEAGEGEGVPPTPPPGFEGDWPGSASGGGQTGPVREQLRDLLGQIRSLLRGDIAVAKQPDAVENVRDGAVQLYREAGPKDARGDLSS